MPGAEVDGAKVTGAIVGLEVDVVGVLVTGAIVGLEVDVVGVLVTGAILGDTVGLGVITAVGCTEIDGAPVTGGPTGAGVEGFLVTSMGANVGPEIEGEASEGFGVAPEGC